MIGLEHLYVQRRRYFNFTKEKPFSTGVNRVDSVQSGVRVLLEAVVLHAGRIM